MTKNIFFVLLYTSIILFGGNGCLNPEDPSCEFQLEAIRVVEAYEEHTGKTLTPGQLSCALDFSVDWFYQERFEKYCGMNVSACYSERISPRKDKLIVIKWETWNEFSDEARKELLRHELGHHLARCLDLERWSLGGHDNIIFNHSRAGWSPPGSVLAVANTIPDSHLPFYCPESSNVLTSR